MRTNYFTIFIFLVFFIQLAFAQIPRTISYQGILTDTEGTAVPDAEYVLTFNIYDVATGGSVLWTEIQTLAVTAGIFNAILGHETPLNLDFDQSYWMGISVNSTPELIPRIELTSSAYSLRALTVVDSSITGESIQNGHIVRSINELKDNIILEAGNNISITPVGNTITISSNLSFAGNTLDQAYDQGGPGAGRKIYADSGPLEVNGTSGVLFTGGTPGTIPVEGQGTRMMWYPGKGAFRVGRVDATQWDANSIGSYSIASGWNTTAEGDYSRAMGINTLASGLSSTAFGDSVNAIGDYSMASGFYTHAIGHHSLSFGVNTASYGLASISHGYLSSANGDYSVAMGANVTAEGIASVSMGSQTTATGNYSIAMGQETMASGPTSVALGYRTTANYDYSTAIGEETIASGRASTAMGYQSTASGNNSMAFGNYTAANGESAVAMGAGTIANGSYCTAFGYSSHAYGGASTAIGYFTEASGSGTVALGRYTRAKDIFAFAAGNMAKANHNGSVVIAANSSTLPEDSVYTGGDEQLVLRADGGVYITNTSGQAPYETGRLINTSSGAYLTTGGAWTDASDRNRKENFTDINTAELLNKLRSLKITQWNYKSENSSIKHIGPVAQDFYAIFGVGNDDRSISTIDPSGIALATIQELEKRTRRLQQENMYMKEKIAFLERCLNILEDRVNKSTSEE